MHMRNDFKGTVARDHKFEKIARVCAYACLGRCGGAQRTVLMDGDHLALFTRRWLARQPGPGGKENWSWRCSPALCAAGRGNQSIRHQFFIQLR